MKGLIIISFFALNLSLITTSRAEDYSAEIVWAEQVSFSFAVSGIVDKAPVNTGQLVNKDDLVLSLKPAIFEATVKRARASLAKVKVIKAEAYREFDRAKQLFEQTLLSVHQLEIVKIALIKAKSDFDIAKANLRLAKVDKSNAVLRAPFKAIVLSRLATVGASINVNTNFKPQIRLARIDLLAAKFLLELDESKKLRIGNKVSVKFNGQLYTGSISQIGVVPIDKNSSNLRYWAVANFKPKAAENIRLGQKAIVKLP